MLRSLDGSEERISEVIRKRRSKFVCGEPVTDSQSEEDHKKRKVVPQIKESQEEFEITKGEFDESLKTKWSRLSQTIIGRLGANEMAALCKELEVVGSSEELSYVRYSAGTNTRATQAAEISCLRAQVKQLHARNVEQEKIIEEISRNAHLDAEAAKTTELGLESTVQNSTAVQEVLRKTLDLEEEKEKQSLIIEFYDTSFNDFKTRIGELEQELAAASSKCPGTISLGKEIRDENSVEELRVLNTRLKEEFARVRSELEVAAFQMELEMGKKDEAIAELVDLQNLKSIYDATKSELIELQKQKEMDEAEKTELAELRTLKIILEAERDELAALRSQNGAFEAMEIELKAVFERLPHQEMLLKAAVEELQTLRREKETFQPAIEELSKLRSLKATYEAVTEDLGPSHKQRASFESEAAEGLAALRKQKAVFETVAEELEELRKQKELSDAEREELELFRRQREVYEEREGESVAFHGRENAKTLKEESHVGNVDSLILKQGKLASTVKYLERKRTEDKEELDRYCSELDATRTKVHRISLNLKAVEQQLLSVTTEKEALCEEKQMMLSEKEALQAENNRLFTEKQNLECRLRQASEQNKNLQFDIEPMERKKARLEIDSTVMVRELFLKEAKIAFLEEKLRLEKQRRHRYAAHVETLFDEVDTLREANQAYMDQEKKLREQVYQVSKRLEGAATKDLCCICLRNTRDTLVIPCTHMQSCVRCVKELILKGKPCPTCGEAISGFVHSIPAV